MTDELTPNRVRWSAAADATLRTEFEARTADAAIAVIIGTTPAAVQHRRKQLRLLYQDYRKPKWTPEMDQTLIFMRAVGYSASLIADKLETTRCAVLGRANRLNLPTIRQTELIETMERKPPPPRVARKARPFSAATVDIVDECIPEHQRKTLFELTSHTCRWPVGDPCESGFFFCGGESGGWTYCPAHMKRATGGR